MVNLFPHLLYEYPYFFVLTHLFHHFELCVSLCCSVLSCSVVSNSLRLHGLYSPWNSLGQNTGVDSQFPSPLDLPNPGIEPRSPSLQADSLPAEPPGKPENTGVGSLSLLQGIFPTQESNRGLRHCRRILYQLSYLESWRLPLKGLFQILWIYCCIYLYLKHLPQWWAPCCLVLSNFLATPGTAAHQAALSMGILQARILKWVAMPSSRRSSQPRDWTQVSHNAGGFFTAWTTREAQEY